MVKITFSSKKTDICEQKNKQEDNKRKKDSFTIIIDEEKIRAYNKNKE